ncbi:hypothetical protein CspeluHIS016_0307160 [Cutaneotrichosporon spelunceum]|uniref:Uncharacterized protein n=1 Tax=Cutaneotrichosporon spelunceum TaxID=1672016 RepID=A0AAD3TTZ3_9TREE|nr:hypothetical protein CspeluHIS016_0307160 [Cutaneotrichosporon spelunceum]
MSSDSIELKSLSGAGSASKAGSSSKSGSSSSYPPPPRREAPGTLGRGYREAEERAKAHASPAEGALDATSYYGMAAAAWQQTTRGTGGTSLRPAYLTGLEQLTLRCMGLGLLGLAAITVFVVVPAYKPHAPGRKATTTVLAILGCITAVVAWNSKLGGLSVITGIGNGVIGAWGWYAIMFGEDDYRYGKYLKPDSRLKRL